MLKNRFFRIASITVLSLSFPLIAMQFTSEVNWGILDFVVGGVLLFCTGMLLDTISSKISNKYQLSLSPSLILLFLLIWAELAVGIFGTPFGGS